MYGALGMTGTRGGLAARAGRVSTEATGRFGFTNTHRRKGHISTDAVSIQAVYSSTIITHRRVGPFLLVGRRFGAREQAVQGG